jgi:hypothetical protein
MNNLDIIYRPVFYLNYDVSETLFCLRLQVEPTQMGQIESNLCFRTCPDSFNAIGQ